MAAEILYWNFQNKVLTIQKKRWLKYGNRKWEAFWKHTFFLEDIDEADSGMSKKGSSASYIGGPGRFYNAFQYLKHEK